MLTGSIFPPCESSWQEAAALQSEAELTETSDDISWHWFALDFYGCVLEWSTASDVPIIYSYGKIFS